MRPDDRQRKSCTQAFGHMAQMLGAKETEIIQTSGASESNNTAINGFLRASRHVGRHVITTPLEHASVSGCLTAMQEQGAQIDVVSIDRQGRVNLDELAELLRRDTVLVTISAVDSELGVVQPVRESPGCWRPIRIAGCTWTRRRRSARSDILSICGHDEPCRA